MVVDTKDMEIINMEMEVMKNMEIINMEMKGMKIMKDMVDMEVMKDMKDMVMKVMDTNTEMVVIIMVKMMKAYNPLSLWMIHLSKQNTRSIKITKISEKDNKITFR
jgi:hypothetical protein